MTGGKIKKKSKESITVTLDNVSVCFLREREEGVTLIKLSEGT